MDHYHWVSSLHKWLSDEIVIERILCLGVLLTVGDGVNIHNC